jgi:hypothetical protein
MSGLPRELLRWIQSLDLSYSIKNPKRDFANGFLVAEIFSKYYKSDFQMHSFDPGTSLPKKKSNWELLTKLFAKIPNFQIDQKTIDGIIHCQPGAAVPVLERIYTLLTNKQVFSRRSLPPRPRTPPFARGTATHVIKTRLNEPDSKEVEDRKTNSNTAKEALDTHEQDLRMQRALEPYRFQPKVRDIQRVPTRKISNNKQEDMPKVEFQKVQVKQLDNSIASLRSRKSSPIKAKGDINFPSLSSDNPTTARVAEATVDLNTSTFQKRDSLRSNSRPGEPTITEFFSSYS